MLIWYEFFYENNMLFNIFSLNFQLLRFLILILFLFKDIIQLLLRHGANMGVKNWEEQPPVNRILPATLQEFSFFLFKIFKDFWRKNGRILPATLQEFSFFRFKIFNFFPAKKTGTCHLPSKNTAFSYSTLKLFLMQKNMNLPATLR